MADSAELAQLMVRLMGESVQYQKMLSEAVSHTEHAAHKIEESTHEIEGFSERIEGWAGKVERALGSIGVVVGLHEALEKFEAVEKTIRALSSNIEVNGGKVKETLKSYSKFAQEIRETTAYGKKEVFTTLQRIETMGLTGEAAKQAAKDTLALATATGHDSDSMARAVALYRQGHTEMLKHMLNLRGITNEQEIQERIAKKLEIGNKQMLEEGETLGAKLGRAWETMGKISVEIGEKVAKGLEPFADKIEAAAKSFSKLDEETREWIVKALIAVGSVGLLVSAWGYLKVAVIAAGVAIEVVRARLSYLNIAMGLYSAGIKYATAITLAWQAALVVGIAYAISEVTKELSGVNKNMEEMEKRIDKLKRDSEALRNKIDEEKPEAVTSGFRPDKRKALADFMHKTTEEVDKQTAIYNTRVSQLNDIRSGWLYAAVRGITIGFRAVDDPTKELEEKVEQEKKNLEARRKKQKEANEAYNKFVSKPSLSVEDARKLQDYNEELDRQAGSYKLVGIELELYKWKALGATDAQLAHARSMLVARDATKEALAAEKEYWDVEVSLVRDKVKNRGSFIDSLRREMSEYGKTNEQIKIAQAIEAGWKGVLLSGIAALIHRNEVLKRGADLMKEHESPASKFKKEVMEINEAFQSGAITQDIKFKALEAAKKAFDAAGDAAVKAMSEMQKFDGALRGSAEAKYRLESSLQNLRDQSGTTEAKRIAQGLPPNNPQGLKLTQDKLLVDIALILKQIRDNTANRNFNEQDQALSDARLFPANIHGGDF